MEIAVSASTMSVSWRGVMLVVWIIMALMWAWVATAEFLQHQCWRLFFQLGAGEFYYSFLEPAFFWTKMALPIIGWFSLTVMVALCLHYYIARQRKAPKTEGEA